MFWEWGCAGCEDSWGLSNYCWTAFEQCSSKLQTTWKSKNSGLQSSTLDRTDDLKGSRSVECQYFNQHSVGPQTTTIRMTARRRSFRDSWDGRWLFELTASWDRMQSLRVLLPEFLKPSAQLCDDNSRLGTCFGPLACECEAVLRSIASSAWTGSCNPRVELIMPPPVHAVCTGRA